MTYAIYHDIPRRSLGVSCGEVRVELHPESIAAVSDAEVTAASSAPAEIAKPPRPVEIELRAATAEQRRIRELAMMTAMLRRALKSQTDIAAALRVELAEAWEERDHAQEKAWELEAESAAQAAEIERLRARLARHEPVMTHLERQWPGEQG